VKQYEWEVWKSSDGTTLCSKDDAVRLKKQGLLEPESKLIHSFVASTGEEASSIYNLRMGFEPYIPEGIPVLCPHNCGSYFYPEGSGQCPYCGDIN